MGLASQAAMAADASTGPCTLKASYGFLGFPTWYKYLDGARVSADSAGDTIPVASSNDTCEPQLNSITDTWRVVAAVIEMLIHISTLVAIGFIVYGGVTYTISQGQPDKTKQALRTIINALVGLVIAIVATALISFIAGSFK